MRLDVFLPFLRKPNKQFTPKAYSRPVQWLRRLVPGFFKSNFSERKPGLLRRIAERLGPSWLSAPLRRVIQAACLIAFMVFFFYVCWPYDASPNPDAEGWPAHYTEKLADKEVIDTEVFLALDPLLSISTAIAGKAWIWSLGWAAILLIMCIWVPRGFCGYLCPLGTVIDLFDWAIGNRVSFFKVEGDGWWVHLKYYLLFGIIASSISTLTFRNSSAL